MLVNKIFVFMLVHSAALSDVNIYNFGSIKMYYKMLSLTLKKFCSLIVGSC